jgi:lysophospholipase L1-like esterase
MALFRTFFHVTLLFFIFMNGAFSQQDTVLIDFGSTQSPLPWNNVISPVSGQVSNLLNSIGNQTGYSLSVHDSFNGINSSGTQNPDSSFGFPSSATLDSFFGNTVTFNNGLEPTGGVRFSGLDITKLYTIVIFASRIATDNRQTCYDIEGLTIQQLCLNASSNTALTVTDSLYPAPDGTITITTFPGPDNNNTYGFFYLNAMKLIYDHVPDTGQANVTLKSPVGGEIWQAGTTPNVIWSASQAGTLHIEYSTDQGNTWNYIGSCPAYYQSYPWTIPYEPSGYCLVRITSDTLSDVSSSFFEITDDTLSCKIVVLGSSTAYGAGASVPDSSWVNRFGNVFFQNNTRFSTINLAKGGYTTYHLMPDGTSIPTSLPFTSVDTGRNITKALTYNPSAIIINLPSNDANYFIPASEQMDNFRTMINLAAATGVSVWITTSQPRNYSNPDKQQIQFDVRDSVLLEFGEYAVDFWTGIADTNGYILQQYDMGDGIHLNDAGHRILFQRMYAKSIDTLFCTQSTLSFSEYHAYKNPGMIYPNPATDIIKISYQQDKHATVDLKLFTQTGLPVRSFSGDLSEDFSVAGLIPGMYFYVLIIDEINYFTGKLIIMN